MSLHAWHRVFLPLLLLFLLLYNVPLLYYHSVIVMFTLICALLASLMIVSTCYRAPTPVEQKGGLMISTDLVFADLWDFDTFGSIYLGVASIYLSAAWTLPYCFLVCWPWVAGAFHPKRLGRIIPAHLVSSSGDMWSCPRDWNRGFLRIPVNRDQKVMLLNNNYML